MIIQITELLKSIFLFKKSFNFPFLGTKSVHKKLTIQYIIARTIYIYNNFYKISKYFKRKL